MFIGDVGQIWRGRPEDIGNVVYNIRTQRDNYKVEPEYAKASFGEVGTKGKGCAAYGDGWNHIRVISRNYTGMVSDYSDSISDLEIEVIVLVVLILLECVE